MSRQSKNAPRRPATKFAHLRKKLQQAKIAAPKKPHGGKKGKG